MGKLTYLRRRYLSPQWKVLACEGEFIFGIITHTYWLKSTAERRARSLNGQIPPGVDMKLYFHTQKVTCI